MSRVMRKPVFVYEKTNAQISCLVTMQLTSAFAFSTKIVQSLNFLDQGERGDSVVERQTPEYW